MTVELEEDIEELTSPLAEAMRQTDRLAEARASLVRRRYLLKKSQNYRENENEDSEAIEKENSIEPNLLSSEILFRPGRNSIYVKTWGCSHNNSDSEYMAGLLAEQGYTLIFKDTDRFQADLWLLNSCTVKNPSEQSFVNAIKAAQSAGKKVVLAGCVPEAQPRNEVWMQLSLIGVQQIDRVVDVVEETLQGRIVRWLGPKRIRDKTAASKEGEEDMGGEDVMMGRKRKAGGAPLQLPKIRKNPFVEIVPINTGCLNQCTYCKTKHARGDLGSYPPHEIIDRVRSVLDGQFQLLHTWFISSTND